MNVVVAENFFWNTFGILANMMKRASLLPPTSSSKFSTSSCPLVVSGEAPLFEQGQGAASSNNLNSTSQSRVKNPNSQLHFSLSPSTSDVKKPSISSSLENYFNENETTQNVFLVESVLIICLIILF